MNPSEELQKMTLEQLLPYDFDMKQVIPSNDFAQVITEFVKSPEQHLIMFPGVNGIAVNTKDVSFHSNLLTHVVYFENNKTLQERNAGKKFLSIHSPPYKTPVMTLRGSDLNLDEALLGVGNQLQIIMRNTDNASIQFWNQGPIYKVPFSQEKVDYLQALLFFDRIMH